MQPSAKIIAHSATNDWRPTVCTMEVVMHRFVLAEFNTHRVFSRNSASSRAIPFEKQLLRVTQDPAIPLVFPREQPGMQGGDAFLGDELEELQEVWLDARTDAAIHAKMLADRGVHKSVVNRLLEPFMWHTVIVTSTEWDNFFTQRCSPLAQPEIRATADAMMAAYESSVPNFLSTFADDWHLPYIEDEDWDAAQELTAELQGTDICRVGESIRHEVMRRVSAARCARVSYLTHDGKRDLREDLKLYDRLVTARPAHWSPLEHVCRPKRRKEASLVGMGNLEGWVQLRHIVSGQWKEHFDG